MTNSEFFTVTMMKKVEWALGSLIESLRTLNSLEVAVRPENPALADNLRLLVGDLEGRMDDRLWLNTDGTINPTFLE